MKTRTQGATRAEGENHCTHTTDTVMMITTIMIIALTEKVFYTRSVCSMNVCMYVCMLVKPE